MGLIEQAAKRLEQLKHAGVEVPVRQDPGGLNVVAEDDAPEGQATSERVLRSQGDGAGPFRSPSHGAGANGAAVEAKMLPRRSKQVEINLERLAADGYVTPAAPRSR